MLQAMQFGDGTNAGDVSQRDSAGRDIHQGLPPEQVVPLLDRIAAAFGDERQYRRLESARRDQIDQRIDERLDRLSIVLGRVVAALIAQAAVLGLLLLIVLAVLGTLLLHFLTA